MVNTPIEYKQIIISSSRTVRFSKCKGQKRVANLGNFSPKKAIFRILWELKKVPVVKIEHLL
jgi:hypothetical protein